MDTLTIPAGGGQICLEVKYTQNYECEDGSSGTYNCVASCEDISWTPDISDEYKEYITWNPSTCCLSSTWDGGHGGCVKLGELTADAEINGVDGSSTVEIYQGDCGEDPVCEYGPVVVSLSFGRMPYTGNYTGRVCATYSYSQTNTLCDGGTETLTNGGEEEWVLSDCLGGIDPNCNDGNVSLVEENNTICVIGPTNDGDAERIVAKVSLTVTMPHGEKGTAECEVWQAFNGCSYSDYVLKFTNADGTTCTSLTFDADGGTQCFKWYVYATASCGDGSVTADVDVTSMMTSYNFSGNQSDIFRVVRDPDDSTHGICVTAYVNEDESNRTTCAGVSIISPIPLSGCVDVIQEGTGECSYGAIEINVGNNIYE